MELIVRDLSIGYDGAAILDDISFCVESGAYLCIIGDNGTGKSTLLKTISGLQKPLYGKIEYGGEKGEIGYLPQQTEVQRDFPATVNEIVATGILGKKKWYKPFYCKKEKELIAWAISKVNITDIKDKCFRELSGGQQRRVMLARALVAAESLVILDEPTAGLDSEAVNSFYELLGTINKKEKATIVMVTHDIEKATKYATHVLHLKADGYLFGTVKEYLQAQINIS